MLINGGWFTPDTVFEKLLVAGFPVKLFLDSAYIDGKVGRYSFICIGEKEKLIVRNSSYGFLRLKEFYKEMKKRYKDLFGIFGYFSYDAVRYVENLPNVAVNDVGMPEISFFLPDTVIVFDNLEKRINIFGETDCKDLFNTASFSDSFHEEFSLKFTGFNMSKDYFISSVEKIKKYIEAGDTFQVNFSQRIEFSFSGLPIELYRKVKRMNPSPFSFYMDMDGYVAVSCSPERLIRKVNSVIETRPIAGTRKRGKNRTEDVFLSRELLLSEKEKAEHIMLVDLERNDMGKVAKFGTVQVDELMTIEKYSHVIHIVSNVIGKVDKDVHPVDIVKAMFPGGTITGAPKVRTMEIIEELEPTRRALYTGSVGYFGFDGNFDFNIVIRTMLMKKNRAYLQVGAGVVWDSVPEKEYEETLNKARAFLEVGDIRV